MVEIYDPVFKVMLILVRPVECSVHGFGCTQNVGVETMKGCQVNGVSSAFHPGHSASWPRNLGQVTSPL